MKDLTATAKFKLKKSIVTRFTKSTADRGSSFTIRPTDTISTDTDTSSSSILQTILGD